MIPCDVSARRSTDPPTAVVLDAASAAGIGVIRSLGTRGIPVVCLDPAARAAGFRSRYAEGLQCPDPRLDAAAFVAFLLEVAAQLSQRGVIFPAGDDSLRALTTHGAPVADAFVWPFGARDGAPVPPDLRRAALDAELPWAEAAPPGAEIAAFGSYCDRHSRVLAAFTARLRHRRAPWPRHDGIAVADWQEDLARSGTRLLRQLRFHGTSLIAFSRDEAGQPRLLAFTPRHWSWHALSAASGVDLTQAAYRDAIGKPYVARRQTDGARWSVSLAEVLGGGQGGEAAPGAAFSRDGVFSLADPLPAAATLVAATRRLVSR
jgi:predicted ATP-grasp superfamily ATP-dependent carboligase